MKSQSNDFSVTDEASEMTEQTEINISQFLFAMMYLKT